MNLLSIINMLGQSARNPSQDPSNVLRQPVASGPESAPPTQASGIDFGSLLNSAMGPRIPGLNMTRPDPTGYLSAVQGRNVNAEADATRQAAVRPLIEAAIKQQQDAMKAQAYQSAIAPVNGLVRQQRYGDAANALRQGMAYAVNEGQVKALETLASKYEEMGAQVDQASALAAAAQAHSQGGPQAILQNPALRDRLARYPGGLDAALKQLAPGYEVSQGNVIEKPSAFVGGKPRVVDTITELPKFDQDTEKLLGTWGWTTDELNKAVKGQDPILKQTATAAMKAALAHSYSTGAFKRMGLPDEFATMINTMIPQTGMNSMQVAQALESNDPVQTQRASAIVDRARAQLQKQKSDLVLTELRNKRQEEAGDKYEPKGGFEVWNRNDLRPVSNATVGAARNSGTWYDYNTGKGSWVEVSKPEAQNIRLIQGAFPIMDAMDTLSKRLLSSSMGGNLPTGALGDLKKLAGDPDFAQLKQLGVQANIEVARILGGSVRVPVTMLKMIDGTMPTNYSTVQQAQREIGTFKADLNNRVKSVLGYSPKEFDVIPTGQQDQPTRSSKGLVLPPR